MVPSEAIQLAEEVPCPTESNIIPIISPEGSIPCTMNLFEIPYKSIAFPNPPNEISKIPSPLISLAPIGLFSPIASSFVISNSLNWINVLPLGSIKPD